MHPRPHVRRALALAMGTITLAAAGAAAFEPTVTLESTSSDHIVVTDLVSRGGGLVVASDWTTGDLRYAIMHWSTEGGAAGQWDSTIVADGAVDESQATLCDGTAVSVARAGATSSSTSWTIVRTTYQIGTNVKELRDISTLGDNRIPDVACVANRKAAVAWYQQGPDGGTVRLSVGSVNLEDPDPQTLTVGTGSMNKGLAIAASAQRVLVAWVDGSSLKVRRYSVGPAPDLTLTSLGTTTIVTHRSVRDPKIATDGRRALIAYQHQADLRVRWSTDRGATFGAATTLRNEPYPSEVGISPTTVALVGKAAVIGALELVGIETLTGKGMGWKTFNAGVNWKAVPTHLGGRTVATLMRVDGTDRYAEAFDQSIADPATENLRFRRE